MPYISPNENYNDPELPVIGLVLIMIIMLLILVL